MESRLERLRARLSEEGLDGMLVTAPENRRYLSGFTGSAGYLVVSRDVAVLATDFRYTEQARGEAPGFHVERIVGEKPLLPRLLSDMGVKRVGFESQDVTVAVYERFKRSLAEADGAGAPELVSTSDLVDRLRVVKDSEEMALLTRAVEIADEALDEVAPRIRPGHTEQQVAWELEKAMRERGADSASFDTIVGAGPNGALPHHRADGTVIKEGDPVVIDMGARYQGYCSDLTRTIFIGDPDDEFRKVYGTVLRAQLTAEEQVVAGMTGGETDAISRDIIARAGYGDNFGHSLGHGVGLAVHEFPRVGPKSDESLQDGMVFTIEPGIYISGWGGVRIEDMVVLESGRPRVLSRARKLEV